MVFVISYCWYDDPPTPTPCNSFNTIRFIIIIIIIIMIEGMILTNFHTMASTCTPSRWSTLHSCMYSSIYNITLFNYPSIHSSEESSIHPYTTSILSIYLKLHVFIHITFLVIHPSLPSISANCAYSSEPPSSPDSFPIGWASRECLSTVLRMGRATEMIGWCKYPLFRWCWRR